MASSLDIACVENLDYVQFEGADWSASMP